MLGAENGMCSYAHLEPLAPLGTFVPIPRVDPPRRSASPRPQRERTHFALLVADGCTPITSAGRLARDVLRLWHRGAWGTGRRCVDVAKAKDGTRKTGKFSMYQFYDVARSLVD